MMSGEVARNYPFCAFKGMLTLMGLEWTPGPSMLEKQVCEKSGDPFTIFLGHPQHQCTSAKHQVYLLDFVENLKHLLHSPCTTFILPLWGRKSTFCWKSF